MRHIVLILFSFILLSACGTTPSEQTDPSKLKRYKLKGEILSVNKANKTAAIKHGEIPGFMSAMTMDFNIKEDWVWDDLKVGSQIKADLVVDNINAKSWLENIVISTTQKTGSPPVSLKKDAAIEGKKMIDFTLTNQDNKTVSAMDFKGKVWVLTFIYARCPLPDFCILMSKNFSDVANKIANDDVLRKNVRLLSISFDPANDTPKKLRQYGLGYLGKDSKAKNFEIWQLAVGKDKEVKKLADFFGLRYEVDKKDKKQFIHSLRTAVISPNGKILKIFTGNGWSPEELLTELKKGNSNTKNS